MINNVLQENISLFPFQPDPVDLFIHLPETMMQSLESLFNPVFPCNDRAVLSCEQKQKPGKIAVGFVQKNDQAYYLNNGSCGEENNGEKPVGIHQKKGQAGK
jgi:hypothetical protein